MGMPQLAHHWTREEVLALPDDGNRYELIDGELLVSPSPRPIHQRAVLRLYDRLKRYSDRHGLGEIILAPADPSTSRGDHTVKRPAFQRAGVAEYWIVDTNARLVERWQPADLRPEIWFIQATGRPRQDLEPFELDLTEYFSAAWGETSTETEP